MGSSLGHPRALSTSSVVVTESGWFHWWITQLSIRITATARLPTRLKHTGFILTLCNVGLDTVTLDIPVKTGSPVSAEDKFYLNGLHSFVDGLSIDIKRINDAIFINLGPEKTDRKSFFWLRSLKKIVEGEYWAKRSEKNKRLNTNFTQLPNAFFDVLKQTNDLLEIDARNSQFAILANMIKGEVNDDFVVEAIKGRLYEVVASKLGESRARAKEIMFQTIYSQPYAYQEMKDKLRKLYPDTMRYINNYKQVKGYNQLAVDMQIKEAEIYIDGVLKPLYAKGVGAISKHDSIIFHRSDEELIRSLITNTLDSFGFKLELKVE